MTTALLSPLPPRPWHPTHASLLRGARRHVQRLPRPTSPSRPPPRPRRWPRRPRRSPCGSFGSRAPSLSRPRCSPRRSPRPSGRRRRQGVTSAPPEHLPGGQRLRSGAGGPCEPAVTASAYSKACLGGVQNGRGAHTRRRSLLCLSAAPLSGAASCVMRVPSAARPRPCPTHPPTRPQDHSTGTAGDTGRPPRALHQPPLGGEGEQRPSSSSTANV
mmetsp:Transcript_37941/g.119421  ORF Transcript_37941/g.119421 Transcript_37941/m.119421 type:complete len:216 (-) Transcript_37941:77-724(-)